MIEKLGKRVKTTVINTINRLIKKYGVDEVRVIVNHVFTEIKERNKLENEIKNREKELANLHKKMGMK